MLVVDQPPASTEGALACLRAIQSSDSPAVCRLIRDVLTEYGCVGPGYAYADPELEDLAGYYANLSRAAFWVITAPGDDARILGCGGYGPLKGSAPEAGIAELQKLYLLPEARGKGLGSRVIQQSIAGAIKNGYRLLYLETVPQMADAIRLYTKFGFTHIEHPLGDTGHAGRCPIRMTLALGDSPASVN